MFVQRASAAEEIRSTAGISTNGAGSGTSPAKFIAVSVTDSVPAVVCRVRHPTGWVIECASWPDPNWIKELAGERR